MKSQSRRSISRNTVIERRRREWLAEATALDHVPCAQCGENTHRDELIRISLEAGWMRVCLKCVDELRSRGPMLITRDEDDGQTAIPLVF